jgi:hypothetical protein
MCPFVNRSREYLSNTPDDDLQTVYINSFQVRVRGIRIALHIASS